MAQINFPDSPSIGDLYTQNGQTWRWTGTVWISNDYTLGNVTLSGNTSITGNLAVSSSNLVANLNADLLDGYNTAIANTASTLAVRDANGNVSANFFVGNGSQLTGIITSVSNVSNGTSNLDIPSSDGNVIISVSGNSNIFTVTGTGTNVAGTLNVTGNANVGNLGTDRVDATGNISANFFIGNGSQLTGITSINSKISNGTSNVSIDTSNGNVTVGVNGTANIVTITATSMQVGTGTGGNISGANVITANIFTGVFANGNSNISIPANNGNVNITAAGNTTLIVRGIGANITGTLGVSGNANVGNLGTSQVLATANITAPQVISNVATGTSPLVVTSTTLVANLNADLLEGYSPSTANTANTIALRDVNGNISANYFIGNGSQLTGISGGATLSTDNTSATTHYLPMSTTTTGAWTNGIVSDQKLYFVPSTGTLSATIFNSLSDINFKENITAITNAVSICNSINPVYFNWKDNKAKSIGVIAQEIETILPEVVSTNDNGFKTVSYDQLIPILLQAVKDLSAEIELLKQK